MKLRNLRCEMCGGNDLIKKDVFFECQYCGTKYSIEEIKEITEEQNNEYELEKGKIIQKLKEEILNQQMIEEDKPRKIIVRRSSGIGFACKMICYINDEEICRLSEKESFETELEKGIYNFKCRLTLGNPMSNTYKIDLDRNYIAKISATQGTWKPQVKITYQNY